MRNRSNEFYTEYAQHQNDNSSRLNEAVSLLRLIDPQQTHQSSGTVSDGGLIQRRTQNTVDREVLDDFHPDELGSTMPSVYASLEQWQVSAVTRLRMEPRTYYTCAKECGCCCHRPQRWRGPKFLGALLGHIFIGYSGLAFSKFACDKETCRGTQARGAIFSYTFPRWFIECAVHLAINTCHGGLSFNLFVPRVVSGSEENGIFELISAGQSDAVRNLLQMRKASPFDTEPLKGYTPLHVSRLFHVPQTNIRSRSLAMYLSRPIQDC
jgi:hypothetical protein